MRSKRAKQLRRKAAEDSVGRRSELLLIEHDTRVAVDWITGRRLTYQPEPTLRWSEGSLRRTYQKAKRAWKTRNHP